MPQDEDPIHVTPRGPRRNLRGSDALSALTGEELAAALIKSGAPMHELQDTLSAHADGLQQALHAVRRLREGSGGDLAELRARLMELRDRLVKIAQGDDALASRIR